MAGRAIVLAIDDNAQMLKEFEALLVPRYDLRVVKAASEAIVFLNNNKCDVILLDIDMPNINGFQFLHDIRRIPSYFKVPIIIVSSNTGEEYFKKARSSSANDVLSKPVSQDRLVGAIHKALVEAGIEH
ncbi:MAG: response regulator [Treponema sp.]|nr:response regulator [Treponema sp.]